jgi:hypothetical protein
MTWTTPDHAGFPLFTNGEQFKLPDPARYSILTLQRVLCHALAVRSRNTCVVLARSVTGRDLAAKSKPLMGRDLRLLTIAQRVRYQPTKSLVQKGPNQIPSGPSQQGSRVVATKSRITQGNTGGDEMKSRLTRGNNGEDGVKSTLARGSNRMTSTLA